MQENLLKYVQAKDVFLTVYLQANQEPSFESLILYKCYLLSLFFLQSCDFN